MKLKMKKINVLLILTGLILSSQAFSQVKFGVKTGMNLSNMKFNINSDYEDEPETKIKMGYQFGLIADIPLLQNTLSLQPGLLYNNKGYSADIEKMLEDESGTDIEDFEGYVRVNYNYIELPVSFVYKNNGFQLSAGPYVAIGVGGSFKNDFSFVADGEDFDSGDFFDEDSYKMKPVIGTVDDDMFEDYLDDEDVMELYRAFDFGMNLGVGYQVKSILFNAGYSMGLINLTPKYDALDYDMDEDYTKNVVQKNKGFNFSVSYFFN
jgi:hypothetical protein